MRNIDRRALMLDPVEAALALRLDELRPKTRGECPDTSEQPCPWYGCRHHLGLEVSSSGTIKYREIGPGEESCSLDVADDGEQVYERMGQLLGGLTRERSRQLIAAALARATMAVAIGEKLRTSDRAIIMAELDRVFSARGSRRKVAQGLYTIRKNRIVR